MRKLHTERRETQRGSEPHRLTYCGLLLSAFSCFVFNTSLLAVIANPASLLVDPHREIAGFAASAYGFITQIVARVLVVLTVPLFAGARLPWSVSLLAVTLTVFVTQAAYRLAPHEWPRERCSH